MLELRPTCEAPICTYECTFCAACVENVLGKDPASTEVKHRPVDPAAHARFSAPIKSIPPEKR